MSNPSELLEGALSRCGAEHAEASYFEEHGASTRFANNAITQNISKRSASVTVRAAFGQRVGQASTTDCSPDALRECVARAEAIARAAEPNTDYLPPPGPQQYAAVDGYDERISGVTPEERAAGIRQAIQVAEAAGLQSAGSYATNSYHMATANSAGLRYEQRLSGTQFVMTAMAGDSSGWSETGGPRWGDADPVRTAETSTRKALAAREPREIPPGEYTVILEPPAATYFFLNLAWSLDAKAAHEGRSALTGKERERVGVPGVTLSTQPTHPEVPTRAAGEDGLALPSTTWIDQGVIRTLAYSRFWAHNTGHTFTGRPVNLIMAGGDASLDDLIAGVDRGVLVTRFWYIRFVDPMKLLLTGMTRDGFYWIENGRVSHGLKNMRFNDSPLRCLGQISAFGRQERVPDTYHPALFPSLRLEGFRFTSGTSF